MNSPIGVTDMNKLNWMWLFLGFLYVAFFSWYTSFGGPLSQKEMDHYYKIFEARDPNGSAEQWARLRKFMEEDTGDDFVMINVIDMYEVPLPIAGVLPSDTSDTVLDKYMEYMFPALFSRACHPILYGEAANQAMDLMNAPGMENWTRGAGMRYRSRRDMLEIASNPAFAGAHDFKVAAMAKTIAFPIDPWFHFGDPRLLLALLLGLIGCLASWLTSRTTNRHL